MKPLFRLTLLVVVALALSSGSVFAATWRWVGSDDKVGFFFDTDDIRYELQQNLFENPTIDTSRITFWLKTVYTPWYAEQVANDLQMPHTRNTSYTLTLETIHLGHKTATFHKVMYYDENGRLIYTQTFEYPFMRIFDIVPETWSEAIFNDVRDYARIFHSSLIRNTYYR